MNLETNVINYVDQHNYMFSEVQVNANKDYQTNRLFRRIIFFIWLTIPSDTMGAIIMEITYSGHSNLTLNLYSFQIFRECDVLKVVIHAKFRNPNSDDDKPWNWVQIS